MESLPITVFLDGIMIRTFSLHFMQKPIVDECGFL
jgi:hypothetical protein